MEVQHQEAGVYLVLARKVGPKEVVLLVAVLAGALREAHLYKKLIITNTYLERGIASILYWIKLRALPGGNPGEESLGGGPIHLL